MNYYLQDIDGQFITVRDFIGVGGDYANQLILNDPLVSSFHASLWVQDGVLMLRDENSANGTFVNQARVVGSMQLCPGNHLAFGGAVFTVRQEPAAPANVPPAKRNFPPPPAYSSPLSQTPRSKSGCGKTILLGCALLILISLALGAGGYLLYTSGVLTPQALMSWVGLGPASLQVDNFRDDALRVSILQLDADKDTTPDQTAWQLKSFDIRTFTASRNGRYRVDFGTPGDIAAYGTCTLTVKSGQQYHFVALPDKIVVNLAKNTPAQGSELLVSTSSLCR